MATERKETRPLTFRERGALLILISLAQMILRVLDFANFRLELESDMKELKDLIKEQK